MCIRDSLLPDGTGTVTVTGAGSLLDVTGNNTLYVGYFGDGTLDVNDGGQVQSSMLIAGAGPDAVGTITVDGSDSELSVDEGIILGVWGQGDLIISDGAGVTANSLQIGGTDISDAGLDPDMVADFGEVQGVGTVTVTGAGSTLDVAGEDTLVVGSGGTGTLLVEDGAAVTSVESFIGGYVTFEDEGETEIATIHGGTGTATVTGAGAIASVANSGFQAAGTLALATNAAASGAQRVRAALARVGLDGYFSAVLTARELHVSKPDPAFFEAALAVFDCVPHHAVMVGDNFRTDIVGAKHASLNAVWYNPAGDPPPRGVPIRADAVIHALHELDAAIRALDRCAGGIL